MLEAEMSFVDDLGSVMDLAEDMLRHVATDLSDTQVAQEMMTQSVHRSPDLAQVDEVRQRWERLMRPAWPRLTYRDALDLLNAKADRFQHRPVWGAGLQAEHEQYIAQHVGGGGPVFVTHYPRDIKAFYMRQSTGDAQPDVTVDCFDLLVPELCEIAGGSMREHRLANLIEAMRVQGIQPAQLAEAVDGQTSETDSGNLDWYVDLRRWGCPPHGGFGVGFDRFLCYLSGVRTIRDIVAFPRWYGRCDC
jgi:asparaginyl-tRNA synthetase